MARRRSDVVVFVRRSRDVVTLRAHIGREEVGFMELTSADDVKGGLSVAYAETTKPGAGVGTRLYEAAAHVACSSGRTLTSDDKRSRFSEGFWKKQAKKGRATCDASKPGTRLNDDLSYRGNWKCHRYLLSCPAPASLAGVRGAQGLGAARPYLERPTYVSARGPDGSVTLWLFKTFEEASQARDNLVFQTRTGGRGWVFSQGRLSASTPTKAAVRTVTGHDPSQVKIHDMRGRR